VKPQKDYLEQNIKRMKVGLEDENVPLLWTME
jgi:hypothetical protein